MKNVYFDVAATTATFAEINEQIAYYNSEMFYNPSASYVQAVQPCKAIWSARERIARQLRVQPKDVFFTSCATESNNWVLRTVCARAGSELVISAGEHAAVYETAKDLGEKGIIVKIAPLKADGTVDEDALYDLITDKTALVSVIHVSNETGAMNNVAELAETVKGINPKTLFHSDGVQAFCKMSTDLGEVDFYSLSGHKIHAPKGIGALYVKRGVRLKPFITGGGQENGRRSGTENVAYIDALGEAVSIYSKKLKQADLVANKAKIIEGLSRIDGFFCNLQTDHSHSPHVISCGFEGIRGETLMNALAERGVIIGRGSACSSHATGNRVLSAIGVPAERILWSVRISQDIMTTESDIRRLIDETTDCVQDLRGKLK